MHLFSECNSIADAAQGFLSVYIDLNPSYENWYQSSNFPGSTNLFAGFIYEAVTATAAALGAMQQQGKSVTDATALLSLLKQGHVQT